MKLKFELNQKNFDFYTQQLKPKPNEDEVPETTGPCVVECCDDQTGAYVPATPLNDDPEILKFGAVYETILKSAIEDRDYVCWSDGGYSNTNVFECKDGQMIKAYDIALILDNLGTPRTFALFKGEYDVEGNEVRPIFYYIGEDDIAKYRPKCYVRDVERY